MLYCWKIGAAAGLLSCGLFLFSGDVTSDFLSPEKSAFLPSGSPVLADGADPLLDGETKFAILFSRLAGRDPRMPLSEKEREEIFAVLEKTPESVFLVMTLAVEFKKIPPGEKRALFTEKLGKTAENAPGAFYLVCVAADMFQELGKKEEAANLFRKSARFLLEKKNGAREDLLKGEKREYALYLFRSLARLLTEKKEPEKVCSLLEETFEKGLFEEDLLLLQFLLLNRFRLLSSGEKGRENPLFFWQETREEKAQKAFEQAAERYGKAVEKRHREGKSILPGQHRVAFQVLSESGKYKEMPFSILLSEILSSKDASQFPLLLLSDLFAQKKDESNSARVWKKALSDPGFFPYPDAWSPFFVLAVKFLQSGNLAEAAAAQEKAYIALPHSRRSIFPLARLYAQQRRFALAQKVLEELFPDPEALFLAAELHMLADEPEKALVFYLRADAAAEKGRKTLPPSPEKKAAKTPRARTGEVLSHFSRRQFQIALCAEKLGRNDLLEKHLKKLLAEDPGNAPAMNFLGYSLALQGKDLDFAEQLIVLALAQEKENYAYLDSLAWVKFRKKEYKKAKEIILKALEKAEGPEAPDPVILDHAGDIFLALGEKVRAREYFERSLATYSPELDVEKVLEKLKKLPETAGKPGEGKKR